MQLQSTPLPQQLPLFVTGKPCSKCGIPQPLANFTHERKSRDGHAAQCKTCKALSDAAYAQANREKIAAYKRAYCEANRESISAKKRAHYQANKDHIKARVRRYKEADPERARAQFKASYLKNRDAYIAQQRIYNQRRRDELAAWHRQYYQANKSRLAALQRAYKLTHWEQIKAWNAAWWAADPERTRRIRKTSTQNRRARKALAPGRFTAADVRALHDTQKGLCAYCGIKLAVYHIEHRTPLSRGGSNWPDNLCLSCPDCNFRKGTKTDAEFLIYRVQYCAVL